MPFPNVILFTELPSLLITYICCNPLLSELKAIYLPSGENDGDVSIDECYSSIILFDRGPLYKCLNYRLCKTHDYFFPSGENLGANVIPGKLPTTSLRTCFDIQ